MSIVPVIDIASARNGSHATRLAVAKQIGAACEDIGFFMVTGHDIPGEVIKRVDDLAREFFYRPQDEKMQVEIIPGQATRGYRSAGISTLARAGQDAPPDLRESLVTGSEAVPGDAYYTQPTAARFFTPNRWPQNPPELRSAFETYYAACTTLASELMRLFALALDLPETFFDDKIDRQISALTVNHYPKQNAAPKPGQIRAGAHTDYGSLTILATDGSLGGLQVQVNGEWQDVMPAEGSFIINLGDLMAQWTNDRWRSTLHRVVNPPQEIAATTDRQSTVFFHQPNFDAPVECLPTCLAPGEQPKYPPTTSGAHLMAEIAKTYAKKAA